MKPKLADLDRARSEKERRQAMAVYQKLSVDLRARLSPAQIEKVAKLLLALDSKP